MRRVSFATRVERSARAVTWRVEASLARMAPMTSEKAGCRPTRAFRAIRTGPDQPETAVTLYNLASEVAKKGNSDEALSLLRQSIDHGLLPQYAEAMGQDPDLKTLHGKRGFTALITYAKRHATAEKARLGP